MLVADEAAITQAAYFNPAMSLAMPVMQNLDCCKGVSGCWGKVRSVCRSLRQNLSCCKHLLGRQARPPCKSAHKPVSSLTCRGYKA